MSAPSGRGERAMIRCIQHVFNRPLVSSEWLIPLFREMKLSEDYEPTREGWDNFERDVHEHIWNSRLEDIAEPGTGLPQRIGSRTIYTVLEGPVLVELVHLTEVGVSAFSLDKARQQRDEAYRSRLLYIASEQDADEVASISEVEDDLPRYPRKCLKLFLTDGITELEAMEWKEIPDLELGRTPMGLKACRFFSPFLALSDEGDSRDLQLQLEKVPIIGGVAYLSPENCQVKGGVVDSRAENHLQRLYTEFRTRMRQETLQMKLYKVVSPEELFSPGNSVGPVGQ